MKGVFLILKDAIIITGLVFVMMMVIEYINVASRGIWQNRLSGNRWKQYIVAGLLGAIPGCLGAFTVVALFSYRTAMGCFPCLLNRNKVF